MKHDHDGGASTQPITLPPVPAAAEAVFGPELARAERYVEHLASTGVSHGLIGPREVPRLWERHVLNCAVLTDLLPPDATIADLGAGAGLPGLTLALRRPDLRVVLIEPLLRRVTWLSMVVDDLELGDRVEIRRGRAQESVGEVLVPFVTARAVAPLEKLAGWALPLLASDGSLLAIKGRSAADELAAATELLTRLGATGELVMVGADVLAEPTSVVRVDRDPDAPTATGGAGAGPARTRPNARRRARRSG